MHIDSIKRKVAEVIGPGLTSIIDYGFDLAPYLGELNQTRKITRLSKRFNDHIDQFKIIDKLFSNEKVSREFIQEKIGPIVLSDLIEEHEDAKIVFILYGFENVFINENTNESLIINFYDTLRGLRYEDIRRLYYYAAINEIPFEESSEDDFIGLQKQIYSKLERLYLIKSAKTHLAMQYGPVELSDDQRMVELTTYGLEFVKFISKEFDEGKYQAKVKLYTLKGKK